MTELYHEYTVRSLMEKTRPDLRENVRPDSQDAGQELDCTDIKRTNRIGVTNAKRYGLLMDPDEFVRQEREQSPSPRHRPQTFSTTPLI
jgi:hypothetical protein